MNRLLSITLVTRIIFNMNLTDFERRKVTECVFNNAEFSLQAVQKCVDKYVPDQWEIDRKGCLINRSKIQPYHYMPGARGETDGPCVKVYVTRRE